MVMVGIDAHKRTHTAVAVDEVGRELGRVTVPATSEGAWELVTWVARFRASHRSRWRTAGTCHAGSRRICLWLARWSSGCLRS